MHAPSGDRIFGKKAIVIVTNLASPAPAAGTDHGQVQCPLWVKSCRDGPSVDVRFTPESGHEGGRSARQLRAMSKLKGYKRWHWPDVEGGSAVRAGRRCASTAAILAG